MPQDPITAQLPLALTAPYNNQYLFSDHYLDVLLSHDSRWDAARDETAAFLTWLRDLYAREGDHLTEYNETQLEDHWFIPILEYLGYTFERQASVPGLEKAIRKPDYIFFPTEADRQAAVAAQRTDDYARHACAVGEVKQWGIDLSKKQRGGGNSFDGQNPSFQIDYYLKATGLSWGILANGRQWRLVHRESSYRLDTYYEIDLLDLLTRDDPAALRYFFLFFRQAAFLPDAQGRCFLDDVLAGSAAYAVALEADLQENAYHALELLMQGFFDFAPNGLTAADLRVVYENSLYLLYRLLFILYGESRGLLPMRNRRYNGIYSFGGLKNEITELFDAGIYVARGGSRYYDALRSLFHLVNGDDPDFNAEINVVRYNGGLFDPQQHPFLNEKSVGDKAFTRAVDLLCRRDTASGSKEFVDYRTLDVRHLGSIYEGLLEYQPRLAAGRMVAIRSGKGEQWMPEAQAPRDAKIADRRTAGQVYLETDKGERKATGSYYTPQYIVSYIVEQTLGPLVERAIAEIKAAATPEAQAGRAFIEKVLALNVLDPAMGSGHFLVEATDYLARALATDPYVETDEPTLESDLNHWRRRVVERCIYGVDKNPLAVELAKLSLWLNTFAGDKPLGFLDHHLKCGDSLVGARVAALGDAPPLILNHRKAHHVAESQMNMFAYLLSQRLPVVLGKVIEIVSRESDTYDTVRAKEVAHAAIRQLQAPFQAIADLWVSAHFGHTYGPGEYREALDLLHTPDKLLALETVRGAQATAAERGFFHWELTFPEIFFDQHGQPLAEEKCGFDAVMGNPPYIRSVHLKDADVAAWTYYSQIYQTASAREFDIYLCFVEQGLHLLNQHGLFGMILPNKWLTTRVGETLRIIMTKRKVVRYLVDFGAFQVFDNVTTYTCLLFLNGTAREEIHVALLQEAGQEVQPLPGQAGDWQIGNLRLDELDTAAWIFALGSSRALLNKLKTLPRLEDIATVFMGTGTRADSIFFMESRQDRYYSRSLEQWVEIEPDVIRPALTGQDIDPYDAYLGNALLFPYRANDNDVVLIPAEQMAAQYPQAWAYLNHPTNRVILEGRDKGLFRDRADWYAYGRPQNMQRFEQAKIVCPDVAGRAEFTYDAAGHYIIDTIYAICTYPDAPYSLLALTAILNSPLMTFFLQQTGTDLRGGYFRMKTAYLNPFPLPRIEFTTPAEERADSLAQALTHYQTAIQQPATSNQLLAFTAAQPTDVIHDLLAHLAEQMIELNRQKQQRVSDFTLDLEGVTDPATFAKLQKGKQGRILWKTAACRPYVAEDSHSSHSLEESLAWSEDAYKAFLKILASKITGLSNFVAIYHAHAPAYTALVHRLTATDRLIDQIVYQLYGLTDEEIAIVEGHAPDAVAVE